MEPKHCKLCGDELEDERQDYCPVCEEGLLWDIEHEEVNNE